MKLVMDEKLKHRLVGVSVVLSLGAIFLPAMMKKSSQRLEHNFSVNVQLPPKPTAPKVAVADEEQMFKTIKVAKAQILPSAPSAAQTKTVAKLAPEDFVVAAPVKKNNALIVAKARPAPTIVVKPVAQVSVRNAARDAAKKSVTVAANKPISKPMQPIKVAAFVEKTKASAVPKAVVTTAKVEQQSAVKREIYALQLASFSQLANAQALVKKLEQKGYKASYNRIASKSGMIYKVYAGHSPNRDHVVKLKVQLASAMQLNGFVVNTGVS